MHWSYIFLALAHCYGKSSGDSLGEGNHTDSINALGNDKIVTWLAFLFQNIFWVTGIVWDFKI